ncbi:MAG: hypothetical protein U0T60_02045 [Buchnera aphidicola (Meitanaphis microgallis)]
MGLDNLIHLDKWYKWKELLKWCHLIILQRSMYKLYINNKILKNWIEENITKHYFFLHNHPSGYIFFSNTPHINISSTKIRTFLKNNFSCLNLLPTSVIKYIKKYKLYI